MRIGRFLVAALTLAACGQQGRSGPRGSLDGGGGRDGSIDVNYDGGSGTGCSARAQLIYLVDQNGTFSSFDPKSLQFTDLGQLDCAGEMVGTTNSMAIDHNAVAWVNYQSGNVYRVDTATLKCEPTSFQPDPLSGFSTFGMGFSANTMGDTMNETLFVGGAAGLSGQNLLGTLDTSSMKTAQVGALPGWPELTGTGDAKLWGFFPDPQNARIAEIDKTTAKLGMTYSLPQLDGTSVAWAFAFWGGDFWIFLKRDTDNSTNVWHLSVFDGGSSLSEALHDTGRNIVGAGVSICAPTTIG